MNATVSRPPARSGAVSHQARVRVLGVLMVACIASTAAHYTHNYAQIEHYPAAGWISNDTVKLAILIAWPTLTAAGALGYALYGRRRYGAAYPLLAAYSMLGIVTPGHFTSGNPHIPPFWYATIFTDALLGFAILAFAHWSWVRAGD